MPGILTAPFFPFLLLLGGGVLLTMGDIVAKAWVQTNRPALFAGVLAFYLPGLLCLVWSFHYKNIAVASLLLILCNVLTLTLWSWWAYGETPGRLETAGLLLGLVAVMLLGWGDAA